MAKSKQEAESPSKTGGEGDMDALPKYEAGCCGFGQGMLQDLKRRLPWYLSDWLDALDVKVLASTLFMFFTSIAPAITFASLLQAQTDEFIGAVEVLLSTAVTGILFALFGGQPLCILGVTGPVSIFTITVYQMATALKLPFVPFYGWTQLWAAVMHWALAITNMCDLIRWVTRYSCETFGVLIAIIYLWTGIVDGIGTYFRSPMRSAYFQFIIALGTAWLALTLSSARGWRVFSRPVREIIADYGASVAIIFWTAVPFMGANNDTLVPRLPVPNTFQLTSSERDSWLVNFFDIPWWGGILAIIPGFILTVLFFFDHNVSSLLCQAPEFGLKKGSAYHWDFFVVGIGIFLTGLLGIPPTNGLIPQAPLHTKSLCRFRQTEINGIDVEVVTSCAENRVSNLLQAALIGIFSIPPLLDVIALIPTSALDGLFIYMGFASFPGNQFAERVGLIFVQKDLRTSTHEYLRLVPWGEILMFTLLQALICGAIFGITRSPAGMAFPVLIAVLVPIRRYLLPRYFPGCAHLDHEGPPVEAAGDDEDVSYAFAFEYGHLGGTIQRRLKHTRPHAHSEDLQYQGYVSSREAFGAPAGGRQAEMLPLSPSLVGKIELVYQNAPSGIAPSGPSRSGLGRSQGSPPRQTLPPPALVPEVPLPMTESANMGTLMEASADLSPSGRSPDKGGRELGGGLGLSQKEKGKNEKREGQASSASHGVEGEKGEKEEKGNQGADDEV
uniref:Bicarbonate transporter-like transmembrane domain-containing protein n=1 Tax=Chromera velia CCMP2878 TaxID=1169474 RepID=A0A0G4H0X3_9ALVE|eukprot:Cvel_5516.t1-p1 / transcript=Cvel_5516.t1 / gene=Cvel_5516 / organism=Chromera_velia_CCMP2878 / gene_product=Putative transporter C543.05c, putative / transcript_product=Putative transporter C543.05c, putative / location=Cvel_scaffold258:63610-72198(-) / protein_length=726 / sequence_SO=supercontig / SO=protein_coding / is_pseudo=false